MRPVTVFCGQMLLVRPTVYSIVEGLSGREMDRVELWAMLNTHERDSRASIFRSSFRGACIRLDTRDEQASEIISGCRDSLYLLPQEYNLLFCPVSSSVWRVRDRGLCLVHLVVRDMRRTPWGRVHRLDAVQYQHEQRMHAHARECKLPARIIGENWDRRVNGRCGFPCGGNTTCRVAWCRRTRRRSGCTVGPISPHG